MIKSYFFKQFACDKSLKDSLAEDEFVEFWKQVINIYDQLDVDQGGDIGITEFVKFLQKNAKKYNINKENFHKYKKAFLDFYRLYFIDRIVRFEKLCPIF